MIIPASFTCGQNRLSAKFPFPAPQLSTSGQLENLICLLTKLKNSRRQLIINNQRSMRLCRSRCNSPVDEMSNYTYLWQFRNVFSGKKRLLICFVHPSRLIGQVTDQSDISARWIVAQLKT
jgi:hypothetical protein